MTTKLRTAVAALVAALGLTAAAGPIVDAASARPRGPANPRIANTKVSDGCDALHLLFGSDDAAFDQAKAAGDAAGMAAAYTAEEQDYRVAHDNGCAWAP